MAAGVTRVRPARADDAPAIATIYAPNVRDSAISFELDPPGPEEMRRRIESATRTPWLVCVQHDTLLGYAYATKHRERAAYRWAVEVSVYVDEDARGRGVGAGLYTSLLRILELQGFHRAYAGITLPNPGSVRLHESVGFRPVGTYEEIGFKRGAWHDVGWWAIALAEPGVPPPDPTPFAEMELADPVAEALAHGAARVRPVEPGEARAESER